MIKVRPGDFLTWARHRSNYSEVSGFFPYRHYIIRFGQPKERINEQAPRTIFSASGRQVNCTTLCHQDGGICTINMVHGSTGLFLNLFSRPQGTIARMTGPPTRGRKGLAQGLQSDDPTETLINSLARIRRVLCLYRNMYIYIYMYICIYISYIYIYIYIYIHN